MLVRVGSILSVAGFKQHGWLLGFCKEEEDDLETE